MDTPTQHSAPSLPSSPLPKRVKADVASIQPSLEATPTPMPDPAASAFVPLSNAGVLPSTGSQNSMNRPSPSIASPLLIQKLSPSATTPTRGSAFAAGYDLYAAAPTTIKAKNKGMVSTCLAIAVPPGTYGRIAPRSGLASKHFLDTGAGVIDADYRGEVKVLLFNFSDVDYNIQQGERIAQLVLECIVTPEVIEVAALEASVRGAGGFGSTGHI